MSKRRRKSQKRVAVMHKELDAAQSNLVECHSILVDELTRIEAEIIRLQVLRDTLSMASMLTTSAKLGVSIASGTLNSGA